MVRCNLGFHCPVLFIAFCTIVNSSDSVRGRFRDVVHNAAVKSGEALSSMYSYRDTSFHSRARILSTIASSMVRSRKLTWGWGF